MIEPTSEYFSARSIWLYVLVMSRTHFKVNPHSIVAWMSRKSLLKAGAKSQVYVTPTGLESRTTQFVNENSIIWPNWPNDWAVSWVLICKVHLTVCSCHLTYAFQSEYTLYCCVNVKELLAPSRREIWSLSDCNWTRIQKHLVCKRTLNHLVKMNKWLSCVLSTYLYDPFDCMFLSCYIRISKWIHSL